MLAVALCSLTSASSSLLRFLSRCLLVFVYLLIHANSVEPSRAAERLHYDLMREHNKLIRPVGHNSDILNVSLGLRFIQLIGVDEVNQVITSNFVVHQAWNDYKLRWKPAKYKNITHIDLPATDIWLPDIVLYNNADGNYQITMLNKVRISFNGDVKWEPSAIYKSYCMIDVTYFPYDKQSCDMKFGSWTYDGNSVNLMHIRGYVKDNKRIEIGMDLSKYKRSIEWDVLEASAVRHTTYYPCCREPYLDITYTIVVRRKPLFYTVNLISPCVAISFMTVFVFYLPADSGEKVTLCVSILLSLTVFFLLLAQIVPPTSLTIPLIGKYLLFTMCLVTTSIVVTIIILNVHFRSPSTHEMRPWVRSVFTEFLPKILMIERPRIVFQTTRQKDGLLYHKINHRDMELREVRVRNMSRIWKTQRPDVLTLDRKIDLLERSDVKDVVAGINYIADRFRVDAHTKIVVQDWKYVAFVLDRLFLWIFAAASLIGFGTIILDAPPLYDRQKTIPRSYRDHGALCTDDPWFCLFETDEAG